MKFSLEPDHQSSIQSYDIGQVVVGGSSYTSALVISAEGVRADWEPASLDQISEQHLRELLPLEPEIVILGTGARLRFPSPAITSCLMEQHIAIEVMDTASACRTYNVLLSEDRRVVAALLMIEE
jgi:uncharacterized protein